MHITFITTYLRAYSNNKLIIPNDIIIFITPSKLTKSKLLSNIYNELLILYINEEKLTSPSKNPEPKLNISLVISLFKKNYIF